MHIIMYVRIAYTCTVSEYQGHNEFKPIIIYRPYLNQCVLGWNRILQHESGSSCQHTQSARSHYSSTPLSPLSHCNCPPHEHCLLSMSLLKLIMKAYNKKMLCINCSTFLTPLYLIKVSLVEFVYTTYQCI